MKNQGKRNESSKQQRAGKKITTRAQQALTTDRCDCGYEREEGGVLDDGPS